MRSGLRIGLAALVLSSACGRIGYEPLSTGAAGATGSGTGGLGAGGFGVGGTGAGGMAGLGGIAGGPGTGGAGTGGAGGMAGATGSGGPAGATGAGGAAGATGSGGAAGATGSGGMAGATGSGGMAGATGSGGAAGMAGATGAGGAAGGAGGSVVDAGPACTAATFNGHQYEFCGAPLSWSDAQNDCVAKGMRLVRIDDAAENTWVHDLAFAGVTSTSSNYWPWMGANDLAVLGAWRWTDGALFWMGGSNGTPQGGLYNNWVGGSPTSGGTATDCGILQSGTYWTDFDCTRLQGYVCEQY
jgi:hypothetical protein